MTALRWTRAGRLPAQGAGFRSPQSPVAEALPIGGASSYDGREVSRVGVWVPGRSDNTVVLVVKATAVEESPPRPTWRARLPAAFGGHPPPANREDFPPPKTEER